MKRFHVKSMSSILCFTVKQATYLNKVRQAIKTSKERDIAKVISIHKRVSDDPFITVHRELASSKTRGGVRHAIPSADEKHFETTTSSLLSRQRQRLGIPLFWSGSTSNKPRHPHKPSDVKFCQQLRSVDAAEPSLTKDAAVRKPVRSHVKMETARKKQKKPQLKDA